MQVPGRTVAHGNALHGDVFAVLQIKHPGPVGDALDLGIHPPIAHIALAVQDAGADELHVLHADAGDEGGEGIQRVALPGAQQVFSFLIRGTGHAGQDGKLLPLGFQVQCRAFLKFHRDMAFQEQRAGQVFPLGNQHPPARGAGQDGSLQGGGVVVGFVALRAEAFHVHGNDFFFRVESDFSFLFTVQPAFQRVFRVGPETVQGSHRPVFLGQQFPIQF